MISRATASAGRGPTRLPPSAPAKTAAAKITMLRILMKKPPQLRLLLGRRSGRARTQLLGNRGAARHVWNRALFTHFNGRAAREQEIARSRGSDGHRTVTSVFAGYST